MNPIERAKQYATIFLNAGEKWRGHVPVDATVKGDTVYLQGVCMERVSSGWRLTENDKDVATYIVAGRGR